MLSPAYAYDVVCTAFYRTDGRPEDLGLKFGGDRRFDRVSTATFARMEQRLGASGAELADVVAETIRRTIEQWPRFAPLLNAKPALRDVLAGSIDRHGRSMLGEPSRIGRH